MLCFQQSLMLMFYNWRWRVLHSSILPFVCIPDCILNSFFSILVPRDLHLNFCSEMIKQNLERHNWRGMRRKRSEGFVDFWGFFCCCCCFLIFIYTTIASKNTKSCWKDTNRIQWRIAWELHLVSPKRKAGNVPLKDTVFFNKDQSEEILPSKENLKLVTDNLQQRKRNWCSTEYYRKLRTMFKTKSDNGTRPNRNKKDLGNTKQKSTMSKKELKVFVICYYLKTLWLQNLGLYF